MVYINPYLFAQIPLVTPLASASSVKAPIMLIRPLLELYLLRDYDGVAGFWGTGQDRVA